MNQKYIEDMRDVKEKLHEADTLLCAIAKKHNDESLFSLSSSFVMPLQNELSKKVLERIADNKE